MYVCKYVLINVIMQCVHVFQGQRVETVRQCSSAAQSRFRHTRLRRERESSQRMYVCMYVCMYTPSTYISMNLSTCAYILTILPHSYYILYGSQVCMYVCIHVGCPGMADGEAVVCR